MNWWSQVYTTSGKEEGVLASAGMRSCSVRQCVNCLTRTHDLLCRNEILFRWLIMFVIGAVTGGTAALMGVCLKALNKTKFGYTQDLIPSVVNTTAFFIDATDAEGAMASTYVSGSIFTRILTKY